MSGSAIYDAAQQGPEVISLTMTPVLMVYSSLFTRWALVVTPWNPWLAACHALNVVAQTNQLRRALEYKMENGGEEEVRELGQKAAVGGVALAGSLVAGPTVRAMLTNANLGIVSTVAAADAGPFTVHFWAPSKLQLEGAFFVWSYSTQSPHTYFVSVQMAHLRCFVLRTRPTDGKDQFGPIYGSDFNRFLFLTLCSAGSTHWLFTMQRKHRFVF